MNTPESQPPSETRAERGVLCPRCEFLNIAGTESCVECGTRLYAVCRACGTRNKRIRSFCTECGKPLRVFALTQLKDDIRRTCGQMRPAQFAVILFVILGAVAAIIFLAQGS